MSKLIQKAGFLNPKRAGRYMNYIATRDGVELLDENADSIYMRYIATRPRAEKHGEHGLFGAEDAVDLEKTLGELKAHEGNVWTIIYSLRREDAARLGYDNAASWRVLLRSKQAVFAVRFCARSRSNVAHINAVCVFVQKLHAVARSDVIHITSSAFWIQKACFLNQP